MTKVSTIFNLQKFILFLSIYSASKSLDDLVKLDKEVEKFRQKILQSAFIKRLNYYANLVSAYHMAFAMELHKRMDEPGVRNWQQLVANKGAGVLITDSDRQNAAQISEKALALANDLMEKMGKKRDGKGKKNKSSNGKNSRNSSTSVVDKKKELIEEANGYELAYMGYIGQQNGKELMEAFAGEMALSLEQFNLNWDSALFFF